MRRVTKLFGSLALAASVSGLLTATPLAGVHRAHATAMCHGYGIVAQDYIWYYGSIVGKVRLWENNGCGGVHTEVVAAGANGVAQMIADVHNAYASSRVPGTTSDLNSNEIYAGSSIDGTDTTGCGNVYVGADGYASTCVHAVIPGTYIISYPN